MTGLSLDLKKQAVLIIISVIVARPSASDAPSMPAGFGTSYLGALNRLRPCFGGVSPSGSRWCPRPTYGPANVGKTFLALDIANALSKGGRKVIPAPVL